jgi:hypothetical protein
MDSTRDCPAKLIRRQGIILDLLKLCPIHVRKGVDISRIFFTNEENMIKSYTTTDKVSKQMDPL